MYNHSKAQQSKNRVHISWDILYWIMFHIWTIPTLNKLLLIYSLTLALTPFLPHSLTNSLTQSLTYIELPYDLLNISCASQVQWGPGLVSVIDQSHNVLSHITQYTIQNRNLYISVLNVVLCDMTGALWDFLLLYRSAISAHSKTILYTVRMKQMNLLRSLLLQVQYVSFFIPHFFPVSVWFQLVEISFSRWYRKKFCCIKSLNFFWYVEHILLWYLYSWYIISFRGMYQRWLNDDIPRKLICPFLSAQFSGWLVNGSSYLFSWICLGFSY